VTIPAPGSLRGSAPTLRRGTVKGMSTARTLAFALLLGLQAVDLLCDTLPAAPQLRIEAGMHTSLIGQIAVDAEAHLLVSGSLDKTVRVWDLRSGALLSTLRLPFGPGDAGRIYAVAISPDGEVIAASGRTGPERGPHRLYVLERKTGRVRWQDDNLQAVAIRLKFSRDGQRIAAAFREDKGIRLYRSADGAALAQSTGFTSTGVDFDAAGRLVASSEQGFVFLFDSSLHVLARTKLRSKYANGVAFTPDARKIAVGFNDQPEVLVLSGKDLTPLFHHVGQIRGASIPNWGQVAWTANDEILCAAGNYGNGAHYSTLTCWGSGGSAESHTNVATQARASITDLIAVPQGFVFSSADPAWGTIGLNSDRRVFVGSPIVSFKTGKDALRISPTGDSVQFGYFQDAVDHEAYFSVPQRRLSTSAPADTTFEPPLTSSPGWDITNWEHGSPLRLDGRPLELGPLERSTSLAISSKSKVFLIGTQLFLRLFDRSGREIWRRDAPHIVTAVNLSADGRLAVAAFGDGSIRWYSAVDGKELLSFFLHSDGQRWVAWTPSGYFATSVGGEDLIGWQVNRAPDQVADFFPASRFRDLLSRPDVASLIIDTLDERKAVAEADGRAGSRSAMPVLARLLPPVVTIISPAQDSAVRSANVSVRIAIRSPSGEPVTAIHTYVDGRPVPGSRGLEVVGSAPLLGSGEQIVDVPLQIPPRDCIVAISAETRLSIAEPVPVRLHWVAPSPPVQMPQLYVLAVGVGSYANAAFKLDLPAKDAKDVADAWRRQEGGIYQVSRSRFWLIRRQLATPSSPVSSGCRTRLRRKTWRCFFSPAMA
jgi:WD40 repeat protein